MDDFFVMNRLSAYIDGDLSPDEAEHVAGAIADNPEVDAAYQELLQVSRLVREAGPVEAPARFHLKVMNAVERLPVSATLWGRMLTGVRSSVSVQGLSVALVAAGIMLLAVRIPWGDLGGVGDGRPPPNDTAPLLEEDLAGPAAGPLEDLPLALEPLAPEVTDAPSLVPLGRPPRAVGSGAGAGDEAEEPDAALPTKAATVSPGEARGAAAGARPRTSPPLESYIPEWDRPAAERSNEAAQAQDGVAEIMAYRLHPSSPDVMRQLLTVADRLGGMLLDKGGAPVDPRPLTVERNHALVYLWIPSSSLESVEPYLRKIGGVLRVREGAAPTGGDEAIWVSLEVLYQP